MPAPATGTPVKLKILNNIQGVDADGAALATKTGLALIQRTAGSGSDGDYFTDVAKIQRIDAGPMDLKVVISTDCPSCHHI